MLYPKITIVTPNFNGAQYLERTIKSVIDQNYPNLEYFVFDAQSTDNSLAIIKSYSSKIKYYQSEPDQGIYDALNKAFAMATGEIMGWINSDDMLHKNSLFTIAEVFNQNQDIQWITGTQTVIDKQDRIVEITPVQKWSKYTFFLNNNSSIQQESTFWKRTLWMSSGAYFDGRYRLAGDFYLWSKFFKTTKLYSVDIPLGCFRTRFGEQLSTANYQHYQDEVKAILESLQLDPNERIVLKKIKRYIKYKWLLKSDSLKKKFDDLFSYPEIIKYHKEDCKIY